MICTVRRCEVTDCKAAEGMLVGVLACIVRCAAVPSRPSPTTLLCKTGWFR